MLGRGRWGGPQSELVDALGVWLATRPGWPLGPADAPDWAPMSYWATADTEIVTSEEVAAALLADTTIRAALLRLGDRPLDITRVLAGLELPGWQADLLASGVGAALAILRRERCG